MRRFLSVCIVIIQCLNVVADAQRQTKGGDRVWHAATYHGQIIGKTKRTEMLRLLGQPSLTEGSEEYDPEDPERPLWDIYRDISGREANFKEDLSIYQKEGTSIDDILIETDVRTGVVIKVTVSLYNWSVKDAIKEFGKDYLAVSYEPCKGFDKLPVPDYLPVPYYRITNTRKPNAFEYPGKGIVLEISKNEVLRVNYTGNPMSLSRKEDCKKELERRKTAPPGRL